MNYGTASIGMEQRLAGEYRFGVPGRMAGTNLNGLGWDGYGQLRGWINDAATNPNLDAVYELRGKRHLISRRWWDGDSDCANEIWRVAA